MISGSLTLTTLMFIEDWQRIYSVTILNCFKKNQNYSIWENPMWPLNLGYLQSTLPNLTFNYYMKPLTGTCSWPCCSYHKNCVMCHTLQHYKSLILHVQPHSIRLMDENIIHVELSSRLSHLFHMRFPSKLSIDCEANN